MDELVQIPAPDTHHVFLECYNHHCIATALANRRSPVVMDMVDADDVLDIHVSMLVYLMLFLVTPLWSLHLLVRLPLPVRGLLWSFDVSPKTQVAPIHDQGSVCQHQTKDDSTRAETSAGYLYY